MVWSCPGPYFTRRLEFYLPTQRYLQDLITDVCFGLKDPNIAKIFRATIGGKFAPLLALENQDIDIDALINSFNTALTETANNILGKHRPAKKPWVTDNILKLCDKRRELKQKKNTTEGAKLYTEANQQVKKRHEKSKRDMD